PTAGAARTGAARARSDVLDDLGDDLLRLLDLHAQVDLDPGQRLVGLPPELIVDPRPVRRVATREHDRHLRHQRTPIHGCPLCWKTKARLPAQTISPAYGECIRR